MSPVPAHEGHHARGSVTLEITVLAPALLVLVFTIVQVGLWSYARSLALGAAQEGVAAGRAHGAEISEGRARAERFLDRTASDSLQDRTVTVRATASTVRVEVVGRSLSVLPGVPGFPVRQAAEGPIERFTAP
jgi:Flp pilus assembly protein TadG